MEHTLPLTGIFTALTDAQRSALMSRGEFNQLPLGKLISRQGEIQSHVHMVIQGKLMASCQGLTRVIDLGDINPGELVGELNFVDPMKASANVKAKVSSVVWSIPCEVLHTYCDADPAAGLKLMRELGRLLARRIRRASDKMLRQAEAAVAMYEIDD